MVAPVGSEMTDRRLTNCSGTTACTWPLHSHRSVTSTDSVRTVRNNVSDFIVRVQQQHERMVITKTALRRLC
jgi:hypothetical protein